jgi:hypothetical protein
LATEPQCGHWCEAYATVTRRPIDQDQELTRKLLAGAVIDQVNAGVEVVVAALATLAVAKNVLESDR